MKLVRSGLLLLPVLLFACTGGDDRPGESTAPPNMPSGPGASAIIGPLGGSLTFEQASVTIPAGALTATVTITIDRAERPGEGDPVGDWYDFGPAGIVFEVPVVIAIALDPADVREGASPVMTKYLSHPALDGDGELVSALMILETSWDPTARVATGATVGFSQAGIIYLSCPTQVPDPTITSASWDPCTRKTSVAWRSEAPVFIEYGYRHGYGQPVTWTWAWNRPRVTSYAFPASVVPSRQSAYTWVIKMHAGYVCQGTNYVSGDAIAQVPGFELLPPGVPRDVLAERRANDHVSLSWRPPAEIESQEDGYEISRSPTFMSGAIVLADTNGRYEDRDVAPVVDYFYSVRAHYTVCGRRMTSAWVSASTSQTPTPPADVTGFTATAVSPTSVQLDWAIAARAVEYVLSRTGGAPFTNVVIAAPDVRYIDPTTAAGITYAYTLTAKNRDGSSVPASTTVTTPSVMSGSAACGDLRVSMRPIHQTTGVQVGSCNPGDPGCPNDAVFDLKVERLNGSTADVALFVSMGAPDAWPVVEFQLGQFGGRTGAPSATLTSGQASETSTYEIRTPDYAFSSTPPPVTWRLILNARPAAGGPTCAVPFELEVLP